MLKAILLAVISVLAVIVAARLIYAIVLLLIMLVSAVMNGVVIPVFRGIFLGIVLPILRAIGFVITLPFRVIGAVFAPCRLAPASSLVLGPVCANNTCRCANPTEARFCSRCGATIAAF